MGYFSNFQKAAHEAAIKARYAIQKASNYGKAAAVSAATSLTIFAGNVHAALPTEAQTVTTTIIADAKSAAGLGYQIMAVVLGLVVAFGLVKSFIRKGASA